MATLEQPAKALSIRQPWAALIVAGLKDIENRTWWTNYRGQFYIHAAKTPDDIDLAEICFLRGLDFKAVRELCGDLKYGGLIGRARIIACVRRSDSPWFSGPNGFVIRDAEPIDFVSCRGALNFFSVDSI